MGREVEIAGRVVGPDHEPFIIAEVSGNHGGSLETALSIVDAVAEAGVHAVKLQTYTADTMTIDVDLPAFRIAEGHELWGGRTLYDLYEEAHTPWEWHAPLFERAREHGMIAFSTPFDATAVEFLQELDVQLWKIASSELVDLPLIRACAATGRPVILSTGMATVDEIARAVEAARDAGCEQLVVLGCTADYPADPADSNLRAIPLLAELFDVTVGLSDHTLGIGAAIASVALGARVIEKHVTLDREDGGVDSAFSLVPDEFAQLVEESRRAWLALGSPLLGPVGDEDHGRRFRRSLHVIADVRTGDEVTTDNVRAIRPAGGLSADHLSTVIGRTFAADVARGTPLTWDIV